MTAPVRIAAFVAALAAVFVVALWVGQAFGPQPPAPQPSTGQHSHLTGGHTS
ncbi:hypothetical protein ACQI4F_23295 [Mycolicibacterium vaccae]|uniref:hypothetical protein n=1 Tax=Mycolicibacterium vaccae TaxID=1810 RepID=UPI003CE77F24